MESKKGESYRALLVIRKAAMQRNTVLIGSIFLITFLAFIVLGLLEKLSGRSVYLIAGMIACFGIGYLTTLIRLEIVKSSIDLMDHLLKMD
jgi:uncharacterized membrane protein